MKNDWEFDHVGLVVKDLDEVLAYYPSIGIGVNIGPLSPNATRPVPGSPEEEPPASVITIYGKPSTERPVQTVGQRINVNRVIDNLQVGSLVIECIRGRPDHSSFNDNFFNGHFPGNPTMPGVLMIEAMAQAGGIMGLYSSHNEEGGSSSVLFLGIDKARFRGIVRPGDQLRMEITMKKFRRGTGVFEGKCYVKYRLVCEAEMLAMYGQ